MLSETKKITDNLPYVQVHTNVCAQSQVLWLGLWVATHARKKSKTSFLMGSRCARISCGVPSSRDELCKHGRQRAGTSSEQFLSVLCTRLFLSRSNAEPFVSILNTGDCPILKKATCSVCVSWPNENHGLRVFERAVPWLRSLVAGLSPRRPGFVSGSIHEGFVVDKVAVGVLRFYPVNIIPPSLSKLISSGERVIC
jgi:hypothetical protein